MSMRVPLLSVFALLIACAGEVEAETSPPSLADADVAAPASPPVEAASAPAPSLTTLQVDHVGLTVTDLEASKTFFVDALGFAVRGQDPSYPAYFLSNGAMTITLWRTTDPSQATAFNRKTNVGLHHLALRVASFEELDALHAQLAEYPGVVIEFPPELAYGGPSKHMMVREPSGNRIELVHRPG